MQEFFDRTHDTVFNLFKDILETSEIAASDTYAMQKNGSSDDADEPGGRYYEQVWELRRALAFSVASALLANQYHAWEYDQRYVPGWAAGVSLASEVQGPAAESQGMQGP